jgi:hypothetical protein
MLCINKPSTICTLNQRSSLHSMVADFLFWLSWLLLFLYVLSLLRSVYRKIHDSPMTSFISTIKHIAPQEAKY